MKKVSLIVYQDYVEDVIKTLHEAGLVEIIDISKEAPLTLEEAEKAETHPEAGTCTNYGLRLSRLIDILSKTKKSPSGIKAMLNPQLPVVTSIEDRFLDELYSHAEGILHEIEKNILVHEESLKKLDEQKEKIDIGIEQVSYLKDFRLDISDIGVSDYVYIVAGKTSELPSIEKEIKSLDSAALYSKQFGTGKKREWVVIIAAHISEQEKIEKLCREKITLFDIQHLSGSPKDVIKTLKKEKTKIEDEKKQILSKLSDYASENLHGLLVLREEIRLETVRKEISKNFAKTGSTYIINGWVLEKNEDKLKSLATSASNGLAIYNSEKPSLNPDNPPTYFETPKWAVPFKSLLEMFATPKYNEINPTIIMGIFFVLFFGVMLGDAGYGLVILFLSLFGYIKFSKYSEMIKNWSFMGIWLGLTTTVVGFLTNSFFGDFIPRFIFNDPNQLLYSITIGGIHLPVEPLRNPLTILTIALLFGLVHLNLGIILAIYQSYKNRDFKELITNHFSWVLLQIGGGLLIGDFLLHLLTLRTVEFYISMILVIIGLIFRLIHAGPLGFFDVTGYVGDWLSYARLLALGLATTGMALAFNIVAKLFGDMIPIEIIGIIIMIILLVLLHVINLGLQALGAGVHSLRLQYVEFFNRFYEGGGHEFKPFSIKRKYTKIKEVK
ncbi:MAG: V-type ATP synthase subunit I [Thermoplasmatales archaeon]|nr:MAG: V-type ATP synthase subunit I [Thermoplasmatales archaeon]